MPPGLMLTGKGYHLMGEDKKRKDEMKIKRYIFVYLVVSVFFVCTFFGRSFAIEEHPIGIAYGAMFKGEEFMPILHEIGVRRTKVSFRWDEIEPQEGVYDWQRVDRYVAQISPSDKALLNVFTTGWGTNKESYKGATIKGPRYYKVYRDFIVNLVKRTKGKITYWQRDTEPASVRHFPADKMKEYVEIQKVFYEAVKSVQPDAIVIGGNHNGNFKNGQPENVEFFLYFLREAKDYFDVLDIRLYGDIYDIAQRVKWFRDAMKKYGYQKSIVCTEMGGPDVRTLSDDIFFKYVRQSRGKGLSSKGDLPPFRGKKRFPPDETPPRGKHPLSKKPTDRFTEIMSERNKQLRENLDTAPEKVRVFLEDKIPVEHDIFTDMLCSDIIQRHTIVYACGVEATWYWNLQSEGGDPIFGKMRLMTPDGKKLPSYYCFSRMVKKFGDLKMVGRIDTTTDGVYLYKVTRKDGTFFYVAWYRKDNLDYYDAQKQAAKSICLPIYFRQAKVTRIYGDTETILGGDQGLVLELTAKVVFIESVGE